MNPAGYVGGEFCALDNEDFLRTVGDHARFFPGELGDSRSELFETGTDALTSILRAAGNRSRLWIPANFCMESLARAGLKLGHAVSTGTYARVEDLRGLTGPGDAILLAHFNRYSPEDQESAAVTASGSRSILIEDFTHAPLEIAAFRGDFAFASLRKFAALELAVAYGRGRPLPGESRPTAYLGLKRKASASKSAWCARPDGSLEREYLALYRQAENALAEEAGIILADGGEIRKFHRLDFQAILDARRGNHASLAAAMAKLGIRGTAGDYMYCMARFPDRDAVRRYCFGQGIFPAIHWQDSGSAVSRGTLSFHIDQRYGPADMAKVADRLAAYMSTGSSSA